MKKLTFIFTFLCFGLAFAQYAETPQYEFKSTSSYQYTTTQHQYTIPVAAQNLQEPGTPEVYRPYKVRMEDNESPGYPAADPNWTPIGDAVLPLLLLTFAYLLYRLHKEFSIC